MKLQPSVLRVFTFLARLVGIVWIFGGIVALLSGILVASQRGLYIGVALLLLAGGIGLLIAKRATPGDVDKVRQLAERLKRHQR